jgi:hypothetical protein
VLGLTSPQEAGAVAYQLGDIFAGVNNGQVQHYNAAGTLLETLNTTTGGFTTDMAFDGSGNLYVTAFSANKLVKFDNAGGLVNANFITGLSTPESVVFDQSGNVYVGNVGGTGIRAYNSAGAFQHTVTGGRVDWFDLSADQSKFIYTTEGSRIQTVSNGNPGVAGPDFASGLSPGEAYALRYLADGGVLLADGDEVKRFNSAGTLIQTYDVAGEDTWFSLNLNPDGTSFWSGNFGSGKAYEFDLTGGAPTQTLNTGVGGNNLFGLVIYGEVTQGGPPPSVPEAGQTWLSCSLVAWAWSALAGSSELQCVKREHENVI